ncbi:MAG: hypothetical protein Q7S65_03200 [Nanoarchaeota archaeon]|nr:hypothetical protein [Nanoarchaeota archaeon]
MKLIVVGSYSCMNCLRSFKALKKLSDRYAPDGLEVELIHPPEWDFERNKSIVQKGLRSHGISFPWVPDVSKKKISSYGLDFWPAHLLLKKGRTVYKHIGEGGYLALETSIRNHLGSTGKRVFISEQKIKSHPCVYFGTRKGENTLSTVLEGTWKRRSEFLELDGRLQFTMRGTQAFLVCKPLTLSSKIKIGRKSIALGLPNIYLLGAYTHGARVTLTTTGRVALYALAFA